MYLFGLLRSSLPSRLVCDEVWICRNPGDLVARGSLVDPFDEKFGCDDHFLFDQGQSALGSVVEGAEYLASLSVDKRRNVWRLAFRLRGYSLKSGYRHDGLAKDFAPGLYSGQAYSDAGKRTWARGHRK